MSAQVEMIVDGGRPLRAPGFKPAARGTRARGGVRLQREGRWTTLVHEKAFVGDPLADLRGSPGLWRAVPGAPPGSRRRNAWSYVFELPPATGLHEGEGEPGEHPPVDLLEWARSVSGGSAPEATRAPPREELEGWLDPTRRHVRAGPHLASLALQADDERLALVVPSLVRLPSDLTPARRDWVRQLLCDAQGRWRLARFFLDAEGVGAEVDLSGAPPERIRALFEAALAALTTASAWVLPGLAAAADPRVASRLLDQPPSRDRSRP